MVYYGYHFRAESGGYYYSLIFKVDTFLLNSGLDITKMANLKCLKLTLVLKVHTGD